MKIKNIKCTNNGTIGNVFDSWSQFIPMNEKDEILSPLVWTASAGFVVKIKDGLDFYLRLGSASRQNVGSILDIDSKPVPFMAIDFGSIRF